MRTCSDVYDCELGDYCVSANGAQVCVPGCVSNSDCRGGSYCAGRTLGRTYCKAACSADSDCMSGSACTEGKCVAATCETTDGCEGSTCAGGHCVPYSCGSEGILCGGEGVESECLTPGSCRCPDPRMQSLCRSCPEHYELSDDGSACVPDECTDPVKPHCLICSSKASLCDSCRDGWSLPYYGCSARCPGNCATCDTQGRCTSCAPGFQSSPLCYPLRDCPAGEEYDNCLMCDGDSCTLCRPGFTDSANRCQAKCADLSGIYMCQPDDPSLGFICRLGNAPFCSGDCGGKCGVYNQYSPTVCVPTGVCVEKSCLTVIEGGTNLYDQCAGHGTCEEGACRCADGSNRDSASNCQSCLPGYLMDPSGACVEAPEDCPEGCETCEEGKCITCPAGKSRPDLGCTVSCSQLNCVRCRADDEFFCELCNVTKDYRADLGLCAPVCSPPCSTALAKREECAIQNGVAVCLPQGCVSKDGATGVALACAGLGVCDVAAGVCLNCPGPGHTTSSCDCAYPYTTVVPEDPNATPQEIWDAHCAYYNCSAQNSYCSHSSNAEEGECDADTGECRCDLGWEPPTCSDCGSGYKYDPGDSMAQIPESCTINDKVTPDCSTKAYGNNCKACTAKDGCTECWDDSVPSNGRCQAGGTKKACTGQQIASGCLECTQYGRCILCEEGSLLDETATAGICIAPEKCTGFKTKGTDADAGKCVYDCAAAVPSAPGCLQCSQTRCLLCSVGFEVQGSGCEACTHGRGDGITCTACPPGTVPNADHTACLPEACSGESLSAGCSSCDSSFPTVCTECLTGYLWGKTESGFLCFKEDLCTWPLHVVGNNCTTAICAAIEGCRACSEADEAKCADCVEGLHLVDGACVTEQPPSGLSVGAIAGIVVAVVVVVAAVVAVAVVLVCRKKKATAAA